MKTATDLLNEIDVDFASESDRGYYEDLIKDAMEKYAEQFKGNCAVKFAEWLFEKTDWRTKNFTELYQLFLKQNPND